MNNFVSFVAVLFLPYLFVKKYIRNLQGRAQLFLVKHKGERCRLEGMGDLYEADGLILGDDVFIGRDFFIRAKGKVTIGSYTHISRFVTIHTVNHDIGSDFLPYGRNEIIEPVFIGRYVWIGMHAKILPGVTIGDGAVIGMGTVVSRDVQPGQIVVGPKQRVVGERDKEHTMELERLGRFLSLK